VNHRLGAAIAALAVMSIPALVSANVQSWAVVTGWDSNSQIVTGLDHLWTTVELKHTNQTVHRAFQGDWTNYPPPCRHVAEKWDETVLRQLAKPNKDFTYKFEHYLSKMADHQCKITFVAVDGGGTTNLTDVGPSN
jgi:hypothetical protein